MSMKIELDAEGLRPIVDMAVAAAMDAARAEREELSGRLAYTEPEAAALLGVKHYVLRDCRRRGELSGARVGSRIVYSRDDLVAFLERQKQNA